MDEYKIQKSTLDGIADAINAKTGESGQMSPSEMVEKIESISTGITPIGNIELTQQSETDVTNYASASVRLASMALSIPTVNSSGLITASASVNTSGWIDSAPSSKTLQLSTQGAKTVTPSSSSQTAVAAQRYTTGAVTVAGDSNLIAENIKKDVSIFGVTGTHESGGGLIKIQNIVKSNEIIGDGPEGSTDTITFEVVNNSEFSNMELLIEIVGMRAYYNFVIPALSNADTLRWNRSVGSSVDLTSIQISESNNIITITMQFTADDELIPNTLTCGCVVMTPDFKNSDGFSFLVRNRTCMIENTNITLFNGSIKPIQDITYDDELLVWDFYTGQFTSAKPNWIKVEEIASEYNKLTFADGRTLGLVGDGNCANPDKTGYHRIFNKQAGAFTHTGTPDTPIGTITFTDDGKELELVSQEVVHDTVKFYNLTTDKYYNCFANGILTSCRLSNEYRIEDMKYVGERLLSDKDIDTWYAEHNMLKA